MTQIQFVLELDELGLSIMNDFYGVIILKDGQEIVQWSISLKDLTYQNRIDIIRECKREMKCK